MKFFCFCFHFLKLFFSFQQEGSLHQLFFKMDNCYRESKNKYILGFCAVLVEKSIFKEVSYSHTWKALNKFGLKEIISEIILPLLTGTAVLPNGGSYP